MLVGRAKACRCDPLAQKSHSPGTLDHDLSV